MRTKNLNQQIIIQNKLQSNDASQLAKGAGVSISGKVIGRGLNFLNQVIFARILGPGYFGVFSIGWTILRLISIIGPLGFDMTIVKFASNYWPTEPKKFKRIFTLSWIASFLSGLVIGGILFITASPVAIYIFHKPGLEFVLKCFAFAVPLITTLRILSSTSTISLRLQYSMYAEEISQPLSAILLFIFLYFLFGWKIKGAVWSSVLSFLVAAILASFFLVRLFPNVFRDGAFVNFDHESISRRELFQFSIPTAISVLFTSFISWIDRLLVGYFQTSSDTGIYTSISLISVVFSIILSGIKTIISPMIADLFHKNEMARVEELFRMSTKWGIYISIPLFLFIFFSSAEILEVTFGSEYTYGSLPLIILSFSQLLNIGTGPIDILLIMTGRQKKWLTISGIMFFANLIVNSILIPRFGLIGAAVGTSVTVNGMFIIGLIIIKNDLNIWPYDRRLIKCGISSIITIIILFGLSKIGFYSSILKVGIMLTSSLLIHATSLHVLGLDEEDKELLAKVFRKILRK